MITYESIKNKLGFDPLNPPKRNVDEDPFLVDDHTPSPYSVLKDEESHWLVDYVSKKLFNKCISR